MIIKSEQVEFESRENMDIKVLSRASDFENASLALIKVKDKHGETKAMLNDRIYYVIEGNGFFLINGERQEIEKGDVVIVPKASEYDFGGELMVLLVNVPAFKPMQD